MQPVQYRGYAQGTAFNPIVFSDESQKILARNEQFLRGLQAKQKIERDFEVAKLKQLQENVEKQRQQLNKHYDYEQRSQDRYNQSLQENAAREVRDLKRIAALDAQKPTTVAVVNDIADFLANTSKTAANVIDAVRKERHASDVAEAEFLYSLGTEARQKLLGQEAYDGYMIDLANNKLLATGDEAQLLKKEGYKEQARLKFSSMRDGVRAQLLITTAKRRLQNFSKEFQTLASYTDDNGNKYTRADFTQLDAKDQRAIFNAHQKPILEDLRKNNLSDALIKPVQVLAGNISNQYYGQQIEKDIQKADGEMVLNSKMRMITDRDPESIQTYMHVFASSKGWDYNKSMAEIIPLLSDPLTFSDAERENFFDSTFTNNMGEDGIIRKFHANSVNEIYKLTQQNEIRIANERDNENKIAEQGNIEKLHDMVQKDLEDGTLDEKKAWFADQITIAKANEQYELAKVLNNYIPLTVDYQREQSIKSYLTKLQATKSLYPDHLRALGGAISSEIFNEWMPLAKENEEVLKPTDSNLAAGHEDIESEMTARGRQGADRSIETPANVNRGIRYEKQRYEINYKNARLSGKSHHEAHTIAMGQFYQAFGTDPYKGKYRVADFNTALELRNKGLPAAGFLDDSLKIPDPGVVQDSAARIRDLTDKLGIDAVAQVVTKDQYDKNTDKYLSSRQFELIPQIKGIADRLGIPYHVVYDHGAEAVGSKKLPEEVKKGADEVINAVRSTPAAKFFNFPGNTDRQNRQTITSIAEGYLTNTIQKSPAALAYEGNYRFETLPKAALPYLPVITKYATKYSIPMPIALGLGMHESKFDPKALSKSDAVGVLQLIPETAEYLGVDPLIPEQNIEGGLRYLREILDGKHASGRKPKNMKEALEMYNAGPNHEDGIYPRNNKENLNYARRVDPDRQPGVLDFADQFRLRTDEGGGY